MGSVTRLPLKTLTAWSWAWWRSIATSPSKSGQNRNSGGGATTGPVLGHVVAELRNPLGAMVTATALLRPELVSQPSTNKLVEVLGVNRSRWRLLDVCWRPAASRKTRSLRRGVNRSAHGRAGRRRCRAQRHERTRRELFPCSSHPSRSTWTATPTSPAVASDLPATPPNTRRAAATYGLNLERVDGHARDSRARRCAGIPKDMLDSY